jgi:hypothetical protein
VEALLRIQAVSPALCEATVGPVAEGEISGGQLASDPGWAIGWALRNGAKAFAAYLTTVRHLMEARRWHTPGPRKAPQ